MITAKALKDLIAFREAALEALDATSDQELLDEAVAEGCDVAGQAAHLRTNVDEIAAAAMRGRMAMAKARVAARLAAGARAYPSFSVSEMKKRVLDCFAARPELEQGVAYRNGDKQTDEDWASMFDDLVEMGAIPLDDQ